MHHMTLRVTLSRCRDNVSSLGSGDILIGSNGGISLIWPRWWDPAPLWLWGGGGGPSSVLLWLGGPRDLGAVVGGGSPACPTGPGWCDGSWWAAGAGLAVLVGAVAVLRAGGMWWLCPGGLSGRIAGSGGPGCTALTWGLVRGVCGVPPCRRRRAPPHCPFLPSGLTSGPGSDFLWPAPGGGLPCDGLVAIPSVGRSAPVSGFLAVWGRWDWGGRGWGLGGGWVLVPRATWVGLGALGVSVAAPSCSPGPRRSRWPRWLSGGAALWLLLPGGRGALLAWPCLAVIAVLGFGVLHTCMFDQVSPATAESHFSK